MSFQEKYEKLFSNEIKILDDAKDCLEKFEKDPLKPQYSILLQNYEKLLKETRKICLISDIQGKTLKKKEEEFVELLNKANEVREQVEYLSYHDALTSLYNRAYIDQVVPELIQDDFPVSVIFIDVNGLKLMNDVFGHHKGDELLKKVANILQRSLRKSDIAIRWGGDEFLVIMPSTSAENCGKVIERIKMKCSLEKKDPIEVSVATGMATRNRKGKEISDLFTIAEIQMYKNKMLDSKKFRQTIINDFETIVKNGDAIGSGSIQRLRILAERFAEILPIEQSIEINNLQLLITLLNIERFIFQGDDSITAAELDYDQSKTSERTSEVGYRLARAIGQIAIADAILGFSENWDGTGYPNQLNGKEIPFPSRILVILHSFNMMINHANLPVEEALVKINQQSGKQFDPALTKFFLDNITAIMAPH
ncbi:MAG TPA: diguanylate cyclase [Bacillus bacterium]|nr:diguanylate cyclase [Bacillus sp. (in: firmicutes)]